QPRSSLRRLVRLLIALFLTAGIVLMPALGAWLAYKQTGEPMEPDLVRGGCLAPGGPAGLGGVGPGPVPRLAPLHKPAPTVAARATVGGGRRVEDPELVRAFLASHDFPCSRCGYNLRGLPPGPCPECREPIVLHIAGSDLFRPIVWLARLGVAACALSGLLGF